MDAVALAAGERPHLLLLVAALEAEPGAVRARGDLAFSERELLFAARNFLPDVVVALERLARLIDVRDLHGVADAEGAAVGLLLPDEHAKQRRLARAVRPDHADDTAPRQP